MLYAIQNLFHPAPGPSPKREGSDLRKNVKGLFFADHLYLVSKNRAPSLCGEGVGGGVQFPRGNNFESFLNRLLT
jgi:hypothetical protein